MSYIHTNTYTNTHPHTQIHTHIYNMYIYIICMYKLRINTYVHYCTIYGTLWNVCIVWMYVCRCISMYVDVTRRMCDAHCACVCLCVCVYIYAQTYTRTMYVVHTYIVRRIVYVVHTYTHKQTHAQCASHISTHAQTQTRTLTLYVYACVYVCRGVIMYSHDELKNYNYKSNYEIINMITQSNSDYSITISTLMYYYTYYYVYANRSGTKVKKVYEKNSNVKNTCMNLL